MKSVKALLGNSPLSKNLGARPPDDLAVMVKQQLDIEPNGAWVKQETLFISFGKRADVQQAQWRIRALAQPELMQKWHYKKIKTLLKHAPAAISKPVKVSRQAPPTKLLQQSATCVDNPRLREALSALAEATPPEK